MSMNFNISEGNLPIIKAIASLNTKIYPFKNDGYQPNFYLIGIRNYSVDQNFNF